MAARPALPETQRRIFDLARTDRVAATRALAELSLPEQVAAVCETPLSRRGDLLGLLPFPEQVIPGLPEAELCFTFCSIGLADATWLLEYVTPQQYAACVDLDGWNGLEPDPAALDQWIDALAETSPETFLRSFQALDAETVLIYLRHRIGVAQKPDEKEGWDPPAGSQTLDDQFYFFALRPDDDLAATITLLRRLFEQEYWTYFRMMLAVIWELEIANQEAALRWRTGRLQDLGFPPWEEAMDVYRFLSEDDRAKLPEGTRPLDVSEWHLPIWVPTLPTPDDSRHLVFELIPQLDDTERRSAFYAFVALANKVAVADGMKLSDAEFAPNAIEKTADFMSAGIAYIASTRAMPALDVLRRVPMERLFRVGANQEPERARPRHDGDEAEQPEP